MNVDHLLSSILRDIVSKAQAQNRSTQEELANRGQSNTFLKKLVQAEIRQRQESEQSTQRPERPTSPRQPDQPVSPSRSLPGQIRQIYNARGQISQMSTFPVGKRLDSAHIMKQMETSNTDPGRTTTQGPKANEEVIASTIQQNFQLIKDSLKKEKEKRRRRNRFRISVNCAAEEKALELLEILLEHADEADDLMAYCQWARERIDKAEEQVFAHRKNVPEQTQQSFEILRDAILALENGLSPNYIFTRLKDEIQRKKKLLDEMDSTSDFREPSI